MISRVSLAEAVRALGKAMVYVGDAFTDSSLVPLGATEGDISAEEQESYNDLTIPEETGAAIHERKVYQEGCIVTIPLIVGPSPDGSDDGSEIYDLISSVGDGSGGGYSMPQAVAETNLLLIPEREIDPASGLAFDGTTWTPAAPVHAVWIWRAVPQTNTITFRRGEGGKVITEVTFIGLFDRDQPEGHKIWTRGDPSAAGIDVLI